MKTVQVVLDEATLRAADREARRAKVNRSRFIRLAIRQYVDRLRIEALERKQREGYRTKPVRPGEFDVWDQVQAWPHAD